MATVDKEVFFSLLRYPINMISIGVLTAGVMGLVLALAFGKFETKQGRKGLIALAVFLAFVTVLAYVPQWLNILTPVADANSYYSYGDTQFGHPVVTGFFVIYILLVFVFCLTVIWFGSLLRQPAVVNLGMIAVAACIFIQYFSWFFELLPRSLAFIVGGLLILVLGLVLERQRRRIMAKILRNPVSHHA